MGVADCQPLRFWGNHYVFLPCITLLRLWYPLLRFYKSAGKNCTIRQYWRVFPPQIQPHPNLLPRHYILAKKTSFICKFSSNLAWNHLSFDFHFQLSPTFDLLTVDGEVIKCRFQCAKTQTILKTGARYDHGYKSETHTKLCPIKSLPVTMLPFMNSHQQDIQIAWSEGVCYHMT